MEAYLCMWARASPQYVAIPSYYTLLNLNRVIHTASEDTFKAVSRFITGWSAVEVKFLFWTFQHCRSFSTRAVKRWFGTLIWSKWDDQWHRCDCQINLSVATNGIWMKMHPTMLSHLICGEVRRNCCQQSRKDFMDSRKLILLQVMLKESGRNSLNISIAWS